MDIYFEKLTLSNLGLGLFYVIRGRQVYYFELSHLLIKIPLLAGLLKAFRKTRFQVSESPGLIFRVHDAALEAAEAIYQRTVRENPLALNLWRKAFGSEQMHLYIKKVVATEAWYLIKNYLILAQRVRDGHPPVRLLILDNPLNRALIPFLLQRYAEPKIQVRGLSRFPWRQVQGVSALVFSSAKYLARLLRSTLGRRLVIRIAPGQFTLSKELLSGIGIERRSDDFLVDGRLIRPQDILFFYHRSGRIRSRPEILRTSICNAAEHGYTCVDFDHTPVPIAFIWQVLLPRYIVFPLCIFALALTTQLKRPTAVFLHQMITSFNTQTLGWEMFLSCFKPCLNLSSEDTHPRHIAETVALNLHGALNAGYQYTDMTVWRAPTHAYLGYNVYFAWGPLTQNFWKDDWAIDQIINTGYIWGHHYLESAEEREDARKALLGEGQGRRFVVSMFDEPTSPDSHTSEKALYDFYRIGTELLERRSDVTVVAKPKRFEGLAGGPEVQELIAPYVSSGRLKIWDRKITKADPAQVIAISDVTVSLGMGVPYLEAICCGNTGFNYCPFEIDGSPIYSRGYGKVLFGDVAELLKAIDGALDHPGENPDTGLGDLIDEIDPYRDFQAIDRMRRSVVELTKGAPDPSENRRQGGTTDPAYTEAAA